MEWPPTEQQTAVISSIASPDETDNLAVIARAGSGKTSTIRLAVKSRPRGTSAMLCAFNSTIADELARKITGPGITARTLHAIGMRAVSRAFGRDVVVDNNREHALALEVCGDQEDEQLIGAVARLANAVKECAPDNATDYNAIERVGADLGILPDEIDGWPLSRIFRAVGDVVDLSARVRRDRRMSFADMLYVPLVARLVPERADYVFVDEAQDMNLAQLRLAWRVREIARGSRKPGRFIVVGDDRQAIYSWRGAAPGALGRVQQAIGARVLRLTVTHRCATAIVDAARRIVPDLQAAPGAVPGVVRDAAWPTISEAAIGDFVIGRTNASLASACLHLLRSGVRARIAGGSLGDQLVGVVRRLARDVTDVDLFLARLDEWKARELEKADLRRSPAAAQRARDIAETIDVISDECETVPALVHKIHDLFADDDRGHVVCTTVHRAKGLEADRVWILLDSFDEESDDIEEQNLMYVAITRARRELVRLRGQKAPTR